MCFSPSALQGISGITEGRECGSGSWARCYGRQPGKGHTDPICCWGLAPVHTGQCGRAGIWPELLRCTLLCWAMSRADRQFTIPGEV